MKTKFVNPTKIKRAWHVIDAKGKVLGKVASEAAALLRGKYNTSFDSHHDTGDFVIVVNSEQLELTGKKWDDKVYYHHTGYVGGIKGLVAKKLHQKHPTAIIEKAVQGMLPKGPLGRQMLSKLFVYKAAEHPHAAQKPAPRALPN
ncbi:MAG: 50S ribosomal protein L13 [Deltaproteobacteria bacterium]|nr:50S ribosomal protein L13 [Deltaproteobacteria bacterium]